jgi:acetyl esterase/lipase
MPSRRTMLFGISATALLNACSPVSLLNSLASRGSFDKKADIAYGPDPRNKLDVYLPVNRAPGSPVVVFFYGGSWQSGSRSEYLFVGEALASKGITVVIPDYRLAPGVTYVQILQDSAAACAWAFANISTYQGNPDNLFVAGHSAGGYNAAMMAIDPEWLAPYGILPGRFKGLIGLAAPVNFLPVTDEDIKPIFLWPNTPQSSMPINHVVGHEPPTLLLAAQNDTFVYPERNSEQLAARMRAAGDDVTVKIYPRVSHTTLVGAMARPIRGLAPVLNDFSAFVLNHSAS